MSVLLVSVVLRGRERRERKEEERVTYDTESTN
jgi:hypothetical protein